MSLEGLRGLLAEQALRTERNGSQQNQTNQTLRQSTGVQGSQVTLSINAQSVFGARSLSNALNQNLSIANFRPNFANSEPSNEPPLFDFEQVAQNVLRFVGGVITRARDSGANSTELESLFEQARSGVAAGIADAEEELGDTINDEISQGIENSRDRIENGLRALERDIFGDADNNESQREVTAISQSVQIANQNSGDLIIRTRDGDEIEISFDSLRAVRLEQSAILEQTRLSNPELRNGNGELNTSQAEQSENNVDVELEEINSGVTQVANDDAEAVAQGQAFPTSVEEELAPTSSSILQVQVDELRFGREGVSLSITGELDESELVAVGDLLRDVADLADEFFNGNVESAFDQALELGFDDEELIGFALELNQVQQVQVVQTYQSVSTFTDSNEVSDEVAGENSRANVANIGQYLERLQRVFDSDSLFSDISINEFVRSFLERVQDNNISSSDTNRFNQFNQRLLNNLPNSQ